MAIRRFGNSSITSAGGKSSKFWDQITTPGYFESIASATVDSGAAASIVFSNIPQNYSHLQIRAVCRATGAFSFVDGLIQVNGDTNSNYSYHGLTADGGGGTPVYASATQTAGRFARNALPGNSITASVFGSYIIDIPDYAYSTTSKYKTIKTLGGFDNNGAGDYALMSTLWQSATAISSITLTTDGGNFAQYSQFALYGIRGA